MIDLPMQRFEELSNPPGVKTETKAYLLEGPTVPSDQGGMFTLQCMMIVHPDFEPYASKAREKIEKVFASLLDGMLN